jgi:hypothetical protein
MTDEQATEILQVGIEKNVYMGPVPIDPEERMKDAQKLLGYARKARTGAAQRVIDIAERKLS